MNHSSKHTESKYLMYKKVKQRQRMVFKTWKKDREIEDSIIKDVRKLLRLKKKILQSKKE